MRIDGPHIPNPHALRGPNHTDTYRPTAVLAETVSRIVAAGNQATLSTGRLSLFGIYIPAGTTVTSLNFVGATTPLSAGTNQWFALFDSSRNRLAVTADDGNAAWSASAIKTLPISRSVTDAAITSGAATLTSATAAFTASDVGRAVTVMAAGANSSTPLGTSATPVTVSSVTNATTAVLSANAGTTVASGGTAYVGTPYLTTAEGFFYVGINVTAGTVPTLGGAGCNANLTALAPILSGTSTSSLTAATGCPDPAGSLTASAPYPYAYVS